MNKETMEMFKGSMEEQRATQDEYNELLKQYKDFTNSYLK